MSSLFDYDDSQEIVFQARTAGKAIVTAKYEAIKQTGDFLYNSHSDGEFAQRCAMIDDQLSEIAYSKLASVSDSKTKLVKALHTEWSMRHAKCEDCGYPKVSEASARSLNLLSPAGLAMVGTGVGAYLWEKFRGNPRCKYCNTALGKKDDTTGWMQHKQTGDLVCPDCVGDTFDDHTASRKIAESVCEKCKEGKIDSDSPLCKACRKESSRTASHETYITCDGCGDHSFLEDGKPNHYVLKYWHGDPFSDPNGTHLCGDCVSDFITNAIEDGKFNKTKKSSKKLANKYIEKRGDSWVILQKGTGKVLSHHDSKEKAEASFRAMMQSKHGSSNHKDNVKLHDSLHDEWHRSHGDDPCTSAKECAEMSKSYKD